MRLPIFTFTALLALFGLLVFCSKPPVPREIVEACVDAAYGNPAMEVMCVENALSR